MSGAGLAVFVADGTAVGSDELQNDVRVTPPYLTRSYSCYRMLRDRDSATAVFPDGADAYCAARARETGTGLPRTRVFVDCSSPRFRAIERERPTFVSKNVLGAAVAERLALELADGYLCSDRQTEEWLRSSGWRLPPRLEAPLDGAGVAREDAAAQERPLVSVVIAYHERTQYLPFCLEGLARQTYASLEVVVADDGSTSAAARAQLAHVQQRTWPWPLRVVTSPRGGPAKARNSGWQAATAELVAFIDDDDIPFDDMVERLWHARVASGADVAIAGSRLFRGDGLPEPRDADVIRIALCDPRELGLISNQYGGPVALWPRSLLEDLGGFTPSAVEDWVLLARAALRGARMTTPPDPVHWYRQTGASRHSPDPVKMRDAGISQVAEAFAQRLPEELQLLPLLTAGAYSELERRARQSRRRRGPDVLRSLVRRIARR